jgi:hypothetical protein
MTGVVTVGAVSVTAVVVLEADVVLRATGMKAGGLAPVMPDAGASVG